MQHTTMTKGTSNIGVLLQQPAELQIDSDATDGKLQVVAAEQARTSHNRPGQTENEQREWNRTRNWSEQKIERTEPTAKTPGAINNISCVPVGPRRDAMRFGGTEAGVFLLASLRQLRANINERAGVT